MRFKALKVFVTCNKNSLQNHDTNDVPKAEWTLCATARSAALHS